MSAQDALKRQSAEAAVAEVQDGMVLGLGTGSTAAIAVELLGERVRQGMRIIGVPTSERTAVQARGLGIPLSDLAEHPELDLTIDGADEVRTGTLDLIKGLGGALVREKIVAAAADRFVVIGDSSKPVDRIGPPIPLELLAYGLDATLRALGDTVLRDVPPSPDGGVIVRPVAETTPEVRLARRPSGLPTAKTVSPTGGAPASTAGTTTSGR